MKTLAVRVIIPSSWLVNTIEDRGKLLVRQSHILSPAGQDTVQITVNASVLLLINSGVKSAYRLHSVTRGTAVPCTVIF